MIIYPSTILAFKYALLAFYQLFVLCVGIRTLMEEDDNVITQPMFKATEPIKLIKPRKSRKRASRMSRTAGNAILLDVVRRGNSTS